MQVTLKSLLLNIINIKIHVSFDVVFLVAALISFLDLGSLF